MVHYPLSYQFGKKEEIKVLPILQEYFKRDIKAYEERYSKHDFYDEEYNYELKSRTNTLKAYPDTMITENKVTENKKLILVFNYKDCLAYIEYNKEKFATFRRELFSRANLLSDEKIHLFIPVEELTIIKTKE